MSSAIFAVASAAPDLAEAALSRLPSAPGRDPLEALFSDWFPLWTKDVDDISDRGRSPSMGADFDARDRVLFGLAIAMATSHANGEGMLAGAKAGLNQAFRAAGEDEFGHTTSRELIAAHLRVLTKDDLGLLEVAFVGSDGRLTVGADQIRDLATKTLELHPPGRVAERTVRQSDAAEEDSAGPIAASVSREHDPLETALRTDLVKRVRAIVVRRRGQVRSDPDMALVLEHFEDLKSTALSVRELARRTGRSASTLQRRWEQVDHAVLAELGLTKES